MIRELCKHFFEKSFRICECTGKWVRPDQDEVTFQRIPQGAALFCSAKRGSKLCRMPEDALESNPIPARTGPSTSAFINS